MKLSKSAVNTFLKCRREFQYQFLDGMQSKPNEYMQIGTDVHAIAERFIKEFDVDGDLNSWAEDYMPGSGKANTKGGELVRAAQRILDEYYSNGNMRSESNSGPGFSYGYKYNRKGYPINYKSGYGEKTYKYKHNKKGQITEVLITYRSNGGSVYNYKKVFSKWKKISRSVRNCDAYGNHLETPYID